VSMLGRQRSLHQNVEFLMVNIWANWVAVVGSVIIKIFNPSKSQFMDGHNLTFLNDTLLFSACIIYCQFSIV
jgi:hypothetical protein